MGAPDKKKDQDVNYSTVRKEGDPMSSLAAERIGGVGGEKVD